MRVIEHGFWSLIKRRRTTFLLSLMAMAIGALATGAYAFLIGPVVKVLFAGPEAAGEGLPQWINGLVAGVAGEQSAIWAVPVLVLIAAAGRSAGQLGKFYWMGSVGEHAAADLRRNLVKKLHRLPISRLREIQAGDAIVRLISDTRLVQEAITHAAGSFFADGLKVIVLLSVAVALDPLLSVVTFLVLPAASIPIVWVARRLRRTSNDVQDSISALARHVEEDVRAGRVIRGYGIGRQRMDSFSLRNTDLLLASLKSYFVRAFSSPLMEILGAVALVGTLVFASWRHDHGGLVPEHFLSFFAAVLMLYEPLKNLGRLQNLLQPGQAGMKRISDFLDQKEESDEGTSLPPLNKTIHGRRIRYTYNNRLILNDIDFDLLKGELVVLKGESGAGKTTLANILSRDLEPSNGDLLWDDTNLLEAKLSVVRQRLAIVEQRPVLFDAGLKDNLSIGNPDATQTDMQHLLDRLGLADLPQRLGGWNMPLGEEGGRLSEGERQRLAIARALLKQADLLILDEATSALDMENEQAVLNLLHEAKARCAILFIAHREGVIAQADQILTLADGKITSSQDH